MPKSTTDDALPVTRTPGTHWAPLPPPSGMTVYSMPGPKKFDSAAGTMRRALGRLGELLAPPPRARPDLTAESQVKVDIAPKPHEVRRVRAIVADALTGWGMADHADEVLLVLSELVTNAIQHGGVAIAVTVSYGDGLLLLEIDDGSRAAPTCRRVSGVAEHGRGLHIVKTMADDWGWAPREDGTKCVWAVMCVAQAVAL